MRPSRVETFMAIAMIMADRSTCASKHKVGAVLVDSNDRIIATGYNGPPTGWINCDDPTPGHNCIPDKDGRCQVALHAEENIFMQCAINGVSCKNAKLFITLAPCLKCARLILQSGIKELWYMGEPSSSNGLAWLKDKVSIHRYENRLGLDYSGMEGIYGGNKRNTHYSGSEGSSS